MMHGQQNIKLYRDARSTKHYILPWRTVNKTLNYTVMYGQQNIKLYRDVRSKTLNYTMMHGQQNIKLVRDARSTKH
jgi:hypothetical protein